MAAGQFYKGGDVRLKLGTKVLYHSTACTLTVSSKTLEAATKDTNGDLILPDGYNSTLSMESLWADKPAASTTQLDPTDLLAHQIAEDVLAFEFTTGTSGDKIISGNCYVSNTDLGAEEGSFGSASFQFIVSGDITIGTVV